MPPIGLLLGKVDFSSLFIPLTEDAKGKSLGRQSRRSGYHQLRGLSANPSRLYDSGLRDFSGGQANESLSKTTPPGPPPAPPKEEVLLSEIRDLLKTPRH